WRANLVGLRTSGAGPGPFAPAPPRPPLYARGVTPSTGAGRAVPRSLIVPSGASGHARLDGGLARPKVMILERSRNSPLDVAPLSRPAPRPNRRPAWTFRTPARPIRHERSGISRKVWRSVAKWHPRGSGASDRPGEGGARHPYYPEQRIRRRAGLRDRRGHC